MTREFLKNVKSENRLDKIRLIMTNDDVIGGQPTDDENFTSNTPFLDIACTMKFAIDATGIADGKAVAAQKSANEAKTAAGTAQTTANNANTAAGTADSKAVAAQKTANEAKTAASTADGKAVAAQAKADAAFTKVKPITEGGTGATTVVNARKNLGLGTSATLNKTDAFGTSANLVATQLLVDKLQKEMFDAMPVGVIVSWDHDVAPKNWLFVRDQKFSATEYPELAKLYPNLTLNDRRGTVDRALDAGRGFDSGRVLGSYQEDATSPKNLIMSLARPKTTEYPLIGGGNNAWPLSTNSTSSSIGEYLTDENRGKGIFSKTVANETRMKNVATNKIIKAK